MGHVQTWASPHYPQHAMVGNSHTECLPAFLKVHEELVGVFFHLNVS